MDSIYHICMLLIAQVQTKSADGGAAVADAAKDAAEQDPGLFGGFGGMLIPIMLGVMLLYVFMSAKQPQAAQGKSELLENLKKNDKVITAGGIVGTVVNYRSDSEYVTLRVDDDTNTRMQVLTTSIYRVVSNDDTKKES